MNSLTKAGERIDKHPYISAFVISLILLLLYSIIQGIYPFGSATFLRKDLYHQYLPFLYEFRRRLINGESLKYSFNLGLGSSFYAMYVYYLSDPLNFLSIFIPEAFLLEFLTAVTYLKIACASSFMCRYLVYRCPVNKPFVSVLLSLCYGFSGYIASFDWNVMWMWGIALAPLTIMGFEKMFKGEGDRLFILSWAFTVWTNYYIAMLMGIFLVIYFFIMSIEEQPGIRSALKTAFRAVAVAAVSVGISAVLLLPEWASIKSTSFIGKSFPDRLKFYLTAPELMVRSLMSVKVETGLGHEPALYASLAMLFFIPVFFMNKKIPARMKITRGALLLFFYLSFNSNVLEFIWHGFNYPDSIPARQAFLFTITCLVCVAASLEGALDIGRIKLLITAVFPVLFYLICIFFCKNEDHTDIYTWIMSALFILMYLLLALVCIDGRYAHENWVVSVFSLILIFELILNFNMTSLRDVSRKSYFRHKETFKMLSDEAYLDDSQNHGLFVRADTLEERIRNISSLAGYYDLSYFSSTIHKDIVRFYKNFGMKASRVHYMGEGLTPFTSALLGAGYVLTDEYRNNQTDHDIATLVDEIDEDYLYRNDFSLPLAYTIPQGHYELYSGDDLTSDPLYLQNAAAVRLGGEEIFDLTDDCIDEEKGRAVIDIPSDGHYYAWSPAGLDKVTEYTDFSDEPYAEFNDMKYNSIMDLGRLDEGCRVTLECDEGCYPDITLYRLDTDNMRKLTDSLLQDSFTLTSFSDDDIEGTFEISEGRQLLITVPVSDGWEVYVDGERMPEPESFYGLFMLYSPYAGTHNIHLIYHIPLFETGLIISVICMLTVSLYLLLSRTPDMR